MKHKCVSGLGCETQQFLKKLGVGVAIKKFHSFFMISMIFFSRMAQKKNLKSRKIYILSRQPRVINIAGLESGLFWNFLHFSSSMDDFLIRHSFYSFFFFFFFLIERLIP